MSMCLYMGARGVQNRVLGPMELELQAAVSCRMVVLGIELGFSERAARALHC